MAAIASLVFASSASAADPSFDAHGSAEQVYATGLPAGASTSLLDASDQVVVDQEPPTISAGSCSANVTPGDGYHVRLDTDRRDVGGR